jgi:hypothetical protein
MFTATVEEIRSWEKDENGWSFHPELGDWVKLGDGVKLGNGVTLGDWVTLGDGVKLGNGVTLGDWVTLGDGVTSIQLNLDAIKTWKLLGSKHIFYKWVTKTRMSPNFDGGTPVKYEKGKTISVKDAEVSDQQCAPGLHVLRYGYRPEWCGLCDAKHNLICLRVEVQSNDILFGGLPTMDAKLRVRRLKVLD